MQASISTPAAPALRMAGAVLVGGRSTRMGRDKARLRVDGVPLWRRQVGVLQAIGAERVVLVLRPRQRSFGPRRDEIRDLAHDSGPLAGLQAALRATKADWLAVLAVDMPMVDAGWFGRLRRSCLPGRGAVYRTPEGFEPLGAIYPVGALAAVERRLGSGQLSLQGLIHELVRRKLMAVVRLPAAERARAANWNTPSDTATA